MQIPFHVHQDTGSSQFHPSLPFILLVPQISEVDPTLPVTAKPRGSNRSRPDHPAAARVRSRIPASQDHQACCRSRSLENRMGSGVSRDCVARIRMIKDVSFTVSKPSKPHPRRLICSASWPSGWYKSYWKYTYSYWFSLVEDEWCCHLWVKPTAFLTACDCRPSVERSHPFEVGVLEIVITGENLGTKENGQFEAQTKNYFDN